MLRSAFAALVSLGGVGMSAALVFAQSPPPLLVVPSKVTMLVGQAHTFRAVGRDGRMRQNVRWSVSPKYAASLTTDGDEATLLALEPSSNIVLTASANGDSAEGRIEVISAASMPVGTVQWSVNPLPGCKIVNHVQALRTATGPDFYVQEVCPDGNFIRALTNDGRELWRSGGPTAHLPNTTEQTEAGEHIEVHASSFCDSVSSGMSKDDVSKLAQSRNIRLGENERNGNRWTVEEHGCRCNILFDGAGMIVKKKKTIVTD
ncbi:MAG: hypothetical protein LAO23_23660 [Acidobacteriia bacterium]|nr:hypothetical protein [Terriglobia bacterium]